MITAQSRYRAQSAVPRRQSARLELAAELLWTNAYYSLPLRPGADAQFLFYIRLIV